MYDLVTKVLVQTFEEKVGKHQIHNKDGKRRALKVVFSLTIDHEKEDGYRFLDLIIYGPMNYVGVYARERWNVIPLEDLEDEDDGGPKPGKNYVEGAEKWKRIAYHDSCWRTDGVHRLLFENRLKITSFSGSSFYEVIDVPAEIDQES
jgi:hypothetical protein